MSVLMNISIISTLNSEYNTIENWNALRYMIQNLKGYFTLTSLINDKWQILHFNRR